MLEILQKLEMWSEAKESCLWFKNKGKMIIMCDSSKLSTRCRRRRNGQIKQKKKGDIQITKAFIVLEMCPESHNSCFENL